MAQPWEQDQVVEAAPWAQDEVVEQPRKRIDASPSRWSQKVGEGMLPGFNRVTAAVQAAVDPLIPGRTEEWGPDFGARYREHLDANRAQSARTQAEAPIRSALLQTAGALPTAMAAGPATAGQATALGAAYGAGESQGRDPEEILADTMLGAGGGRAAAALPRAFLGVENAGRRASRLMLPKINPTPAAQRLMSEGVPLTAGQMNPNSTVANIEAATAESPFGMGAEREAARVAWRDTVLGKTVPQGAQAPSSGTTQQRQAQILESFRPIYEQISATPVEPEAVRSLPETVRSLPARFDARTRTAIQNEIGNAMTVLPGVEWQPGGTGQAGKLVVSGYDTEPNPVALMRPARGGEAYRGGEFPAAPERGTGGPLRKEMLARASERAARRQMLGPSSERLIPGTSRPNPAYDWRVAKAMPPEPPKVTAGDLLKVRENIRSEMQTARRADDFDRLRLLGHAEDAVGSVIESSLPPEQAQLLRNTDRQYAKLMTVLDAAPGGKIEFTPDQLARSIEHSSGRRAYKTGNAGDLQSITQDAQEVFSTPVKPTGMRGVVLAGTPQWVTRIGGRLVNVPSVRSALMPGGTFALPTEGPTPAPQISLTPQAAAMAEALRRRSVLGLTPATADDTGP